MRNLLITIQFTICLSITGQVGNFLKQFVPSPLSTTANAGVYGMTTQGTATLSQSSFIVGGYYFQFPKNKYDTLTDDGYLTKTLVNGLTKWFRKYHLSARRFFINDIAIKYNGDIIAGGSANGQYNQQNPDGVILTTDSNGYLKTVRIFPKQMISKIYVLKNKKIVILASDSNTYTKLVLMDKDGNLLWSKLLWHSDNSSSYFAGHSITEGANGNLLVVGRKSTVDQVHHFYPYVLLCDSNGNKVNDMSLSKDYSVFFTAVNNSDQGFYLVGAGLKPKFTDATNGHILKVNNQLQNLWHKEYVSDYYSTTFTDLIVYSKNNINILTTANKQFTENRTGFTFIDSMGVIRRNHLFNPLNTDHTADQITPLKNGKTLFALHSNHGRLFGVTDTLKSSFCNLDSLTWKVNYTGGYLSYNHCTLQNVDFFSLPDTAYVYTPRDVKLQYICSSGPTAPLDTINYPPTVPSTLTSLPETNVGYNGDGGILIYPNPATNKITITSMPGTRQQIEVKIIASDGKCVFYQIYKTPVYPLTLNLNASDGIYLLVISESSGRIHNRKFVVTTR